LLPQGGPPPCLLLQPLEAEARRRLPAAPATASASTLWRSLRPTAPACRCPAAAASPVGAAAQSPASSLAADLASCRHHRGGAWWPSWPRAGQVLSMAAAACAGALQLKVTSATRSTGGLLQATLSLPKGASCSCRWLRLPRALLPPAGNQHPASQPTAPRQLISSSAARRAPSAGHPQQPAGRCRLGQVGPWRQLSPCATWCAGQPAGTPAAATPAAATPAAAAPPPAAASTTLADGKSGSSQVLVAGGGSGGLNGCGSSSLGYACFQQVGGASGPAALQALPLRPPKSMPLAVARACANGARVLMLAPSAQRLAHES
jgi:hypothetical protein